MKDRVVILLLTAKHFDDSTFSLLLTVVLVATILFVSYQTRCLHVNEVVMFKVLD